MADWYVWADAKPDGSPPTNWQSVFGGPAWTWDARRGQYYMHNFLGTQPQLNVHNRAVQDALLDVVRFWLDRGVDGFRIDAINFAMHDPELRDNPPAPPSNKVRTRPFDFQLKIHNQSHPDIPLVLERIRALTDEYGGSFTVAEVGGDDAVREMKLFTAGDRRLNSAYGFDFLYADRLTPKLVREAAEQWPDAPGIGWPSWAFENHDAPRAVSRWTPAGVDAAAYSRMKMALLCALRGNIIIYNGEELGLDQVDIRRYDAPLTPGRIKFPEATYVAGLGDNPEYHQDKLRLDYESMVTPDTVYDYDLASGTLETLKVQEIPSGYDATQYVTERVNLPSRDGKTLIPASLCLLYTSDAADE